VPESASAWVQERVQEWAKVRVPESASAWVQE
jgi:hypothetical protein